MGVAVEPSDVAPTLMPELVVEEEEETSPRGGKATLYGYFTLRGPLSYSATLFLEKLSILPVKFYKWEIRVACLSKAYTNH